MLKTFHAVLLGAPGSGKGTISSRIVSKFKLNHISSGDILRRNIIDKTPLGLKTQKYIETGQLVPDDIIIDVMLKEISKSKKNILLDGFPRTEAQAVTLNEKYPVNVAMNVIVPFDVIIDRVQKRWTHLPSGRVYNIDFNAPKVPGIDDVTGEKLVQRDDDKAEAVFKRLETYNKTFEPVVNYYECQKVLEEFHGRATDEIWPLIYNFLKRHIKPIEEVSK